MYRNHLVDAYNRIIIKYFFCFETGCGVVLEKIPIMSPAKVFAYMKERESKRELRGVHEAINTTRDIFNAGECAMVLKKQHIRFKQFL